MDQENDTNTYSLVYVTYMQRLSTLSDTTALNIQTQMVSLISKPWHFLAQQGAEDDIWKYPI